MYRYLLVTTSFVLTACATSSPEPNPAESLQVMESGGEELVAHNQAADKFDIGDDADVVEETYLIEDIEAPNGNETPAEMMPILAVAESPIVCERVVPTGSVLSVRVCRHRVDIARRQETDQKLFDDIKRNTALGAARL